MSCRPVSTRTGQTGALFVLLTALVGCGPGATPESAHDHELDDHAVALTVWTDHHEIFVTGPVPKIGEPVELALLVTDLRTAGPADLGPTALRWRGHEDRTVPATVDPQGPGRFRSIVTLPASDYWHLEMDWPGAPGTLELGAVHVEGPELGRDHDHDHSRSPEAIAPTITLTKAQQWRLGVASEPVVRSKFTQPLRVAATVEAPPERRIVVATPVTGRVTSGPGGTLPVLGQTVAAGEPLLAIRVPLAGDAGALAGAEADAVATREDLQLAEAELVRARQLVAAEAAPQRRLEAATAAVAAARARYEAARRLLDGDDDTPMRTIHAPIDGVIVGVHASGGQFVDAATPLLTVLDPSLVWVRGHIPETALHDLPARPQARLGVHGDVRMVCDIEGAELVFLAPEIDPRSRTAAVVYAMDNHDLHLRPGQSLGLEIDTHTTIDGLVVPNDALIDEHGRPVVYVQVAGESFVKRPVALAGNDGRRSLVTEGLLVGERVVTRAAWAVKLASAATAAPGHGHAH